MGLPRSLRGKECACPFGRPGLDPWVAKIPWRRKWQPTSVFLPGGSHEQGSLADYSLWGCKELDMTKNMKTKSQIILSLLIFKSSDWRIGMLFHDTIWGLWHTPGPMYTWWTWNSSVSSLLSAVSENHTCKRATQSSHGGDSRVEGTAAVLSQLSLVSSSLGALSLL